MSVKAPVVARGRGTGPDIWHLGWNSHDRRDSAPTTHGPAVGNVCPNWRWCGEKWTRSLLLRLTYSACDSACPVRGCCLIRCVEFELGSHPDNSAERKLPHLVSELPPSSVETVWARRCVDCPSGRSIRVFSVTADGRESLHLPSSGACSPGLLHGAFIDRYA